MNAIRERVENAPRLLVATTEENDFYPASVYEEEDGLNTLCYLPGEYSGEWQDALAQSIVDMRNDREKLMTVLDIVLGYGNEYTRRDLNEMVEETLKDWRPREF